MEQMLTEIESPPLAPPHSVEVGENTAAEVKKALRQLGRFALILAAIWLVFYGVYAAIPYTRPGVNLIYDAKVHDARHRQLFVANRANRVLIFGNSLVLSGFKPDLFDNLSRGDAESFNLGLPDELWFTGALQDLLANGQRPTHVLLTVPWRPDSADHRSAFNLIPDDDKFLSTVFPFRRMPRDLVLFAALSRAHGGMKSFYRYAQESVARMQRDRGYYFIEGQSHYSGDQLPADFVLDEDTPDRPYVRQIAAQGKEFQQLRAWSEQYNFDVFLVPMYFREHAVGSPAPVNAHTATELAEYPRFHVLGPDCFRYPNSMFSDHVHLNPRGADVYTRAVYDLIAPYFKQDNAGVARR